MQNQYLMVGDVIYVCACMREEGDIVMPFFF